MPGMGGDSAGCLPTAAVFVLLMAPVYYLFRMFVGLIRQAYGFNGDSFDGEPALRVCRACSNTVMEPELHHCPYCGQALSDPPTTAQIDD